MYSRRKEALEQKRTQTMLYDAKMKLNNVIGYYRNDWHWPSWKYLEIEKQRVHQNNARLLRADRMNRTRNLPTGSDLLQQSMFGDWNNIDERISSSIPAFIRTGESFFRAAELNINAMLKAFTLPALFITLTFSERWEQFQNILQNAAGIGNPLPTDFPWEAVEYYYERIFQLRKEFLTKGEINGFGKLYESVLRYEFQLRQAIHSHMLLWVEKSIPDLIKENYVRADIPDPHKEPELYELVRRHQIHRCQPHLCGGSSDATHLSLPCRKGFPQPLSDRTYHHSGELRYRYRRLTPEDQFVVPYNAQLLLIWQAHINCQYVTTAGLSKYVSKYVTKPEPQSVVSVAEAGENRIRKHIQSRRIGSMELMCLLNSKPIIKLSSNVEFLTNALPEMRTLTIRRVYEIERNPDDPYYPDSLVKYFNRPIGPSFESLKYPEYFQQFVIQTQRRSTQKLNVEIGAREEWRDQRGYYVYRRQRRQLTRSPFRRLADGEAFFYALLLEKNSWRSEKEIHGRYQSYREHFIQLYPEEYEIVITQQRLAQHTHELQYVALYEELVNTIIEHGEKKLQKIISNQLTTLRRLPPRMSFSSDQRYDPTLHMGADQYLAFSTLSNALDQFRSDPMSQRLFFVTGSAGVGKSYLLSAVEDNLKQRRISYLKLAPTGIAAVNIRGQTIHSALCMTTSNFGDKSTSYMTSIFQSEEKQIEMAQYQVLLIDEISMVPAELLAFMSITFGRLHGNGRPFGNICVVAFGDLLQLPPIVGHQIFKCVLWKLFFPIFLTQSRRQKGDDEFIKILNEIRVGCISAKSWDILINLHQSYSPQANLYNSTFIVSHRKTALALNRLVLDSIPSEPQIHYSVDREGSRLLQHEQSSHTFKSVTNLPEEVDTRVGARVMFLDNSLIDLGISNGTTGVVIDITEEGNPKVAFPTMNGIEVNSFLFNQEFTNTHCL
jgi:DNA replication protein DnaC